ncbi:hypothetical protein [Streptomyces sp. NPDC003036]|uniref:hypothetical protein n=1 Tax=Streptomyces sp. NPDC003036 TaxID=3154442 RepID=UPI0033A06316
MPSGPHLIIEPDERLLRRLKPVHWVDRTTSATAYVLLAHPPEPRSDGTADLIEARMRGLAAALRLSTPGPGTVVPNLHRRLSMHHGAAVMELDGCSFDMSIPIGGDWAKFAHSGAQIVVAVGLDPLPSAAPKTTVAAYIASRWYSGRVLMGATCSLT